MIQPMNVQLHWVIQLAKLSWQELKWMAIYNQGVNPSILVAKSLVNGDQHLRIIWMELNGAGIQ